MIIKKKKIIGYTTGVFDLFHVGHVNILKRAKGLCDYLIVGVSTDKLVEYKNKKPVIPFDERIEVVSSCKYVDMCVPQENMDKIAAYNKYKFDLMFVGDDWQNTDKWRDLESMFSEKGVKIIYFPYTKNTSSTIINTTLEKLRGENL